ncbi:hypothetical protein GGR26_000966 [Lewinella marina]|nr:hypothetical protein [Neolewinella marina]NJB85221.1 hypothetical protein [Neolewinella marina]
MKTPYEVRPEGTDAILNEIAMLHRQSAGFYRDIAKGIHKDDDTAGGYFRALADYHEEMVIEVNRILSDMAGGVHTPSRTGETELKKQEQAVNRALQAKNTVELSELAHANEKGVSDAYQHALANPNLIDFARDLLQKQHEKVLIWVNRADRYKTVPQDFNEHYQPKHD